MQAAKLQKAGRVLRDITFEFAQSEIAKNSGLDISNGRSTFRLLFYVQQVSRIMLPLVLFGITAEHCCYVGLELMTTDL